MEVLINNISDSLAPVGVSDLGTLIYDNIVFPRGLYVDLDGNNQSYNEVKLDAVVFTINRTKEIIKSSVSGRNGSIREYISYLDYNITVDAIITSQGVDPAEIAQIAAGLLPGVQGVSTLLGITSTTEPIELLEKIKKIDDVPDRVEIRNKILQNVYGINYVVIANFSKSRIGPETWAVKLELEEDKDIDLGDFG